MIDNVQMSLESSIPLLGRSGSLAEQVRDSLFAAISSGDLAPGTRLREIPLSEHFGLSKTPVREALRMLEAEGLVVVHPRRGAVVTSLDEAEISNLYELRLVLEIAAVRRAAQSGNQPTEAAALRTEMGGYLDEEPQINFHRLDVRFHRSISDLGGNPELAITLMRVHQRIQSVRVRCQVPGRLRIAHRQHGRIVTAIRKGDADAAEEAITEHVRSACEHVLDVTRRASS
jgi:DNA-binding GntR family transcriptional regulator